MYKKMLLIFASLILLFSFQANAARNSSGYVLPDIDGNMQSFDQYRGKWVVVNFWATWCGTCIKELPDLISFHNRNKDSDIVLVGINYEDINPERLKQAVAELEIPFPVLTTKPVEKTPLGPVPALPTTYIINPEGEVIAGEIGIVTSEALEEFIALKKQQGDKLALNAE